VSDRSRGEDPTAAVREVLQAAAGANLVLARRLGLTLTDLTALDHLLGGPPLGTGELAERLGMRSPSATAVLDRLETAGLVRRSHHPTDRRRVAVEVPAEGRARAEEALSALVAELDALVEPLTAAERALVAGHLRAVAGVLRSHGRP
jgi:DNA-binding MarR family transcriptional regulator